VLSSILGEAKWGKKESRVVISNAEGVDKARVHDKYLARDTPKQNKLLLKS
jgi:hypothetical protein